MFPPVLGDGHALFMDFGGRIKWLRALDGFLQANRMPNANLARVEEVMSTSKLAAGARPVVEEYFSTPMPKLLVVTASGKGAYWVANPNDIEGARKRVLANCHGEADGATAETTAEPRRYGFHATIKAPFRLAANHSLAELDAALADFCRSAKAPVAPTLCLRTIGSFFVLTPPPEAAGVAALAAAVVTSFDSFRAPL